jgi:hypothetical protein
VASLAVDSDEDFSRRNGHNEMNAPILAAWVVAISAAAIFYFLRESGGVFDVQDYQPNFAPMSNLGLLQLAQAIATAEGFWDQNQNILQGNIPARAHNPGDLIIPGWAGAKLGNQGISVFSSDAEGWSRLYHQLQIIVDGQSRVYSLDDTIESMGRKWTSTDQNNWSTIVAEQLGIPANTPLRAQLVPSA